MKPNSNGYREFSALMGRGQFAEATRFAERQSVAAGDKDGFWLTQLSLALRESGRSREAFEAADRACALAPGSAWTLLARAEALLKQGAYDAASADFQAAQSDERTVLRARKGQLKCLAQAKSWDRMLSLLAQWELPGGEAYYWRIKALMGQGLFREAEFECRQWLDKFPDNPKALWKSVELQMAIEGVEPVRLRMGRLAKIPGKPAVYGEIYASLCKRTGNLEDAAGQYEKLLKRGNSPALLRKQAFALAKTGREDLAVPLMEELIRLSPDDMYLNAAYPPACNRLGDTGRASTFYHELIALHPDCKTLYGSLMRVQKLIGKDAGPAPTKENPGNGGTGKRNKGIKKP